MNGLLEVVPAQKRAWVSGFSIFRAYCAVKSHFQGTYDISKYNINVKVTQSALDRRSDRVFFERLSKKLNLDECYRMFVSNIAANPNVLSYELAGSDSYEFYLEHCGFLDVFSVHFKSELVTVFELLNKENKTFKDLFNCNDHPVILQLVLRNIISIETFVVLNRLLKFVPVIDKNIGDDLVWHNFRTKAMAYDKLLKINEDLAKKLFKEAKNNI